MKKVLCSAIAFGIFSTCSLVTTNVLAAETVTGAGASFPAPLYAKWAAEYNKSTGVKINYQSIGSGGGIKQIDAKTVDFGASDEPLKDEDLDAKGLVQFPTVIGGVVPIVNIKGIKSGELKLTGEILANIFLGKITHWNDDAIQKVNPDLKLPDEKITSVVRADASGTSFGFTDYLSRVSPEWKDKVGAGKAVSWPGSSTAGKGNEGVAAFVTRLSNSIGYVEYSYATQNNITVVSLQNHDGNFVQPNAESFKAAAAHADWSKTFFQILNDKPGAESWPITSTTYILMHKAQEKPEKANATLKFFAWAYQNGDQMASDLDYVAIPSEVKDGIYTLWGTIKDKNGNAIEWK